MPPRDAEQNRAYCREYHKKNWEQIKARRHAKPGYKESMRQINKRRYDRRKAAGVCAGCGSAEALPERTLCAGCNERQLANQRKSAARLRDQVILAYGGYRCACCGEAEPTFLTVDHVANGGNRHRREIGGCGSFYRWLRKNHFPPGFQVLCFNCNLGKQLNGGVCPHETR
jgi:hypothetical protein